MTIIGVGATASADVSVSMVSREVGSPILLMEFEPKLPGTWVDAEGDLRANLQFFIYYTVLRDFFFKN